ncbi:PilZ domain-containing protein [Niveibacterium sp.]|uniref:PilZ domain-containing protein n=1 Tax=Niveibacterium sp. TaxID=2017444 RepID=UPI0035B4C218
MSDKQQVLIPVADFELTVGKPVPYNLFTRGGILVLAAGSVVADDDMLGRLLSTRPFRTAEGIARAGMALADEGDKELLIGESRDPFRELGHAVESIELFLRLPGDDDARPYNVPFFGLMPMQALIVGAPFISRNFFWRDHEGLPLFVKLRSGRYLYAFETSVTRYGAAPAAYLMLAYPKVAQRKAYRSSLRVSAALPAVIEAAGKEKLKVAISDMSDKGCAVDTQFVIGEIGSQVTLTFRMRLDNEAYMLSLPCIIRNQQARKGGLLHYGLSFGDTHQHLPWHQRMALKAYLYDGLIDTGTRQ